MAELKMEELKMVAIIKLISMEFKIESESEWRKSGSEWMSEVFFVQNGWIEDGRYQDSWNHQVESEWISEVFLCKCWELILACVSEFERKN